jgi:type IV pilus assembly protein PilN
MRLDINLATRPYEDAREFWGRWGLGVGLLAVLTLFLLGWTMRSWQNAGRDRQNIAQLQAQIAERDRERIQAQAFLDMSTNRSTRDQSQFLNGLIQRKAFSWTRVFEELELVMPANLHVVSLRPELNDLGQMELEMRVVGDTRGAAVDLVQHMEGSKHFQRPQLVQETAASDKGASILATVDSIYIPDSISDLTAASSNSSPDSSSNASSKSGSQASPNSRSNASPNPRLNARPNPRPNAKDRSKN